MNYEFFTQISNLVYEIHLRRVCVVKNIIFKTLIIFPDNKCCFFFFIKLTLTRLVRLFIFFSSGITQFKRYCITGTNIATDIGTEKKYGPLKSKSGDYTKEEKEKII